MRRLHPNDQKHLRKQRGTAYVLVLAITTLLVTLGIAATHLAQNQIEQGDSALDQAKARLAAQSYLDILHRRNNGSTTWRDGVATETWFLLTSQDGIDLYYAYDDPIDGDLDDDYTEPFRLYTLAKSGTAFRIYSVEYTADTDGNLTRNASTFKQEVFVK